MKTFAPIVSTTVLAAGLLASVPGPAFAQEIGLVAGTFNASYIATAPGCTGLLVTGQFLAPTPGYTVTLAEASPQDNAMLFKLEASAVPPSGQVPQVVTLTPVHFAKPDYSGCHYGVSIKYEDQEIVVGLFSADVEKR